VVDVKDFFGAESKSQGYAHFHEHIQSPTICYDDACQLKKFTQNLTRNQLTSTAKKMSQTVMVCDKFHFKNHKDMWCKRNCSPYTCASL
ncbi:unnamed protein product, partial [Porites lobata]